MTTLLIKLFVKHHDDPSDPQVRLAFGNLSSAVGIAANLILSAAKILAGLFFGALSVTADGVNNLSDTLNSIILLVGFKLSNRPADKEHPFGHGRIEYIAGLAISFFIMILGFSLLKSSFTKILYPETLEVGWVLIGVLLLSLAVKIWLYFFYMKIGKTIDSIAVIANAKDSLSDVVSTGMVLLGICITKFTSLNVDGYLGVLVAVFIIRCAVILIKDTITPLLGSAPSRALCEDINNAIMQNESVIGVHDLTVHSYGSGKVFATAHAEVDARQDILTCHDDIDNIEKNVYRQYGVELVIHMDPVVLDDPQVNKLREITKYALMKTDPALSMHDFRVVLGKTHHNLVFDLVVPYGYGKDVSHTIEQIKSIVNKHYPGKEKIFLVVNIDNQYT